MNRKILFTKNTYSVLGDPGVLGNRLHTKLIYHDGRHQQLSTIDIISDVLKNYSWEGLTDLDIDQETMTLLRQLLTMNQEDNWNNLVTRYFEGLLQLLNRETVRAKSVPLLNQVMLENLKTYLFDGSSSIIVEIDEVNNHTLEINYIALGSHSSGIEYSPAYDGEFSSFRDTQCTFIFNFETGLFSWIYLNVQPDLRGQGIGTSIVKKVENFAFNHGFNRFSVEWPNRGYWVKYLDYVIDERLVFLIEHDYAYTIEIYKEMTQEHMIYQ